MKLHNEARGFRNNNPGNIRHGEKWLGLAEKQTDPDFCQFVSVEYGIRAMFKTLETYREKYGLKTVREMITRWAPPSENDTEAYINDVLAVTPGGMIVNIIAHENGIFPFSDKFIHNCRNFGE